MPSRTAASNTHEQFAIRVREERSARGLTQDQLAKLAGIPTTTITSIEVQRRRVRIDEAVALASALEIPLERLLGGVGEAKHKGVA